MIVRVQYVLMLSIAVVLVWIPSANGGQIAVTGLKSRSCITGLCIYPMSLTREQLVNEYGGKPKEQTYCYLAKPTNSCITLKISDHPSNLADDIESINLDKQCTCKNPISPKKTFPNLLTSEGLGLGDAYKRIIALYGIPNWIRAKDERAAKKFGLNCKIAQVEPRDWQVLLHGNDFVFCYVPDPAELNALFIYLKDDHVIEIEASVSE